MLAALSLMPSHLTEISNYIITLIYNQWQVHFFSQGFHRLQTMLMFGKGMNIGVIPEKANLISLLPPVVGGIGSAVGAAAMNQKRVPLHCRHCFARGWAELVFLYYRLVQGAYRLMEWPICLGGFVRENPVAEDKAHRHP